SLGVILSLAWKGLFETSLLCCAPLTLRKIQFAGDSPLEEPGFEPTVAGEFARDSLLEQAGFEPPVPAGNDARRSAAVARRRGVGGRTVRPAPYPRYPPTARVVFFDLG